jgi:hypothetical protein
MSLIVSHSTSGREKEGYKEGTGVVVSIKIGYLLSMEPWAAAKKTIS